MIKIYKINLVLFLCCFCCLEVSAQLPEPDQTYRGLWVTQFKNNVLGNETAEDALIAYAIENDFNYLICTNMFQILTASCGSFTSDMNNLRNFIAKAHDEGITYVSGNVGSLASAEKIQSYNNCISVLANEKLDMITYECEFYNAASNGSCPSYASYISQLTDIKSICSSTLSSSGAPLICEAYIGGEGATGLVLTHSSETEMEEIAGVADHILITYYRPLPSSSSGNFFNWTLERLQWIAKTGVPSNIVLLLKSRDTDGNNMYDFLHGFPGIHYDAVRAPYYSWVEGTAFNPSLAKGYRENYEDGTYPWLSGIQVKGFSWFEHDANMEIVVLPIKWNTFSAILNNENAVDLSWSTSSEKNNDNFVIEKSRDAKNWIQFQIVKSKGNSTFEQNYRTVDQNPFPTTSYYRIRQIDMDGKSALSKIESVFLPASSGFTLYPNPCSDFIVINAPKGMNQTGFEIKNIFGQIMEQYNPSTAISDAISVNVTHYPPGIYFYTSSIGKQLFIKH
ncbi:MAG: T9SS type A sorting domain-containing protein [Saprospiraceae bacterium]|nr:T9SS type A sorting domain-containing protein [Saprospiraceae bacterium]